MGLLRGAEVKACDFRIRADTAEQMSPTTAPVPILSLLCLALREALSLLLVTEWRPCQAHDAGALRL